MALATEYGRAAALEELQTRRRLNRGKPRLDNSKAYAGSPMVFYCIGCGDDIVVPECYLTKPSKCRECDALVELGWME